MVLSPWTLGGTLSLPAPTQTEAANLPQVAASVFLYGSPGATTGDQRISSRPDNAPITMAAPGADVS